MNNNNSRTTNRFATLKEANPSKYPSRMGEKWNTEESDNLIDMHRKGKTIKEISEHHHRSELSIKMKLDALICDMIKQGKSEHDVEKDTGVPVDIIKKIICENEEKKKKATEKRLEKKEEKKAEKKAEKAEKTGGSTPSVISDKASNKIVDQNEQIIELLQQLVLSGKKTNRLLREIRDISQENSSSDSSN